MDTGSIMANQMDDQITASLIEKDMFDGNKVIAEFEGWKFEEIEPDYFSGSYNDTLRWKISLNELKSLMINGFRFHSSLDRLIPVVNKISDVVETQLKNIDFSVLYEQQGKVLDLPLITPIDEIWQATINFIKFFNQNKL